MLKVREMETRILRNTYQCTIEATSVAIELVVEATMPLRSVSGRGGSSSIVGVRGVKGATLKRGEGVIWVV